MKFFIGLFLAGVIAGLAYWRRSLTADGAAAAVVLGTLTVGLGGWSWAICLIYFFATSTILSRFREREKETVAQEFAKGGRRDAMQVLSNGGVPLLFVFIGAIWSNNDLIHLMAYAGFAGALAAMTADTWATEIGVLSKSPPRSILSGLPLPAGTSGAISPLGVLASGVGAVSLGIVAAAVAVPLLDMTIPTAAAPAVARDLPGLVGVAGLFGSVVDSLLGATFQARYICPLCEKRTERLVHSCGTRTRPAGGLRWLNNDMVNLFSSLAGGLLCGATGTLLFWTIL